MGHSMSHWEHELHKLVYHHKPVSVSDWLVTKFMSSSTAETEPVLRNIHQYLNNPCEELRWKIFEQTNEAGFGTKEGILGLAVFFMGGSMSPKEYEPVYPPEDTVNRLMLCILMMLAMSDQGSPQRGTEILLSEWNIYTGKNICQSQQPE